MFVCIYVYVCVCLGMFNDRQNMMRLGIQRPHPSTLIYSSSPPLTRWHTCRCRRSTNTHTHTHVCKHANAHKRGHTPGWFCLVWLPGEIVSRSGLSQWKHDRMERVEEGELGGGIWNHRDHTLCIHKQFHQRSTTQRRENCSIADFSFNVNCFPLDSSSIHLPLWC